MNGEHTCGTPDAMCDTDCMEKAYRPTETDLEDNGLRVRGSPGMPLETVMATFDILKERRRQIEQEGWTPAHDDDHDSGQLADAAACYALNASGYGEKRFEHFWPFASRWWKPKEPRRDLVRAAALIIAEIERLDRKGSGHE